MAPGLDPTWRRVAVFRALQLGDLLCAVPAWRALRRALPGAEIVLVGLPWAASFAERFSCYFDDFRAFPGYPGLPEQVPRLAEWPRFLEAMHAERFDLVLQMHGSGRISNPVAALLGGRALAGFYQPGDFCPDLERFLAYPDELPEVQRHLRLLEFLGAKPDRDSLEFPVTSHDRERANSLLEGKSLLVGEYVCVHPGARAAVRRWSPEKFAAVADRLARDGLRIILTGSAEEQPLTRCVAERMHAPALDLAGRTDLGSLAALLAGARLVVCNNTGVSHVAAAVGAPRVVLYHEEAERARWAAPDSERQRALVGEIEPEAVVAAGRELLERRTCACLPTCPP